MTTHQDAAPLTGPENAREGAPINQNDQSPTEPPQEPIEAESGATGTEISEDEEWGPEDLNDVMDEAEEEYEALEQQEQARPRTAKELKRQILQLEAELVAAEFSESTDDPDADWAATVDVPPPEPPVLLRCYRKGSLNLVSGVPGSGKSWKAYMDSLLLARHPNLDLDVRIVAWDTETGRIQRAMRQLGAKPGEVRLMGFDVKPGVDIAWQKQRVDDWAKRVRDRGVVFLDRADHYGDMESFTPSAANRALAWFRSLVVQGLTVVLLSHQIEGKERAPGPQAIEGSMNSIITIRLDPADITRSTWDAYRRGIDAKGEIRPVDQHGKPLLNTTDALRRFQERSISQGGQAPAVSNMQKRAAVEKFLSENPQEAEQPDRGRKVAAAVHGTTGISISHNTVEKYIYEWLNPGKKSGED